MKLLLSLLAYSIICGSQAQNAQSYQTNTGQTHLCGSITITDLQDAEYQTWFDENYKAESYEVSNPRIKKGLKSMQVDIYLGTWCGDSKKWVPRFIKLWDKLGMDRGQLNMIALYNDQNRYKQAPNGEAQGVNIHRVPTFVFKKNDTEYARIVESPQTDMVSNLAQIALGFPPTPKYPVAQYLMNTLSSMPIDSFNLEINKHFRAVYHLPSKASELNTLGYVYLRAGKIEQALVVFNFNTYLFKYSPNTYDSYAEALAMNNQTEEAILNYEKVLRLDPNNENAKNQLKKLQTQ